MAYTKHFKKTPQTEAIPGEDQVKNSAGGYVYEISNWDRFQRFLILGSEGGSYYASERKLTVENARCAISCIKEDGVRAVDLIVEISDQGRAPKNTPALFALALAASADEAPTRKYALDNLSKVARIGTHLFEFSQFVDSFRGWGRGLRDAVADWYLSKDASKVAFQVVKYAQRVTEEGDSKSKWSHRDLLRKVHPQASGDHDKIFKYVTAGTLPGRVSKNLQILRGVEKVKKATSAKDVAKLIAEYKLPHEVVPKEFMADPTVSRALLQDMPLTATMRNLGRLTANGVLAPLSDETSMVIDRLTDESYIQKSRIHPINVLAALRTYAQGRGHRGSGSWNPVTTISDALNDMLYKSFKHVEPTGKKILIALDVSASMTWDGCNGLSQITPREASAVMSMATARVEKNYHVVAFASGGWGTGRSARYGIRSGISEVDISPRMRLDTVADKINSLMAGGTDCALPMLYAQDKGLDVDAFVIYTDNETWANRDIHPSQALRDYRKAYNPDAKLIVAGMTSTGFSIADPKDPGTLDIVGFDSAAPQVISSFVRGIDG